MGVTVHHLRSLNRADSRIVRIGGGEYGVYHRHARNSIDTPLIFRGTRGECVAWILEGRR